MAGLIDFDTACPWELYLFALIHLGAGVVMFFFDSCHLLTSKYCTDTERVMETIVVVCFLYVGVLFSALTHHNKSHADRVTTLSNFALMCSTALLTSVVFAGNASLGGVERSWMHKGDVITMMILVWILIRRVTKTGAEWAPKNSPGDLGIDCKSLLKLILVLMAIKFVACTDFIDPMKIVEDGKMSHFAWWMWRLTPILILEVFLALFYSLMFDDDSHELVVWVIIVMSLVGAGLFHSVQVYLSDWMGLNGNALWIQVGVLILVCIAAIIGGRRNSSNRSGYQNLSS